MAPPTRRRGRNESSQPPAAGQNSGHRAADEVVLEGFRSPELGPTARRSTSCMVVEIQSRPQSRDSLALQQAGEHEDIQVKEEDDQEATNLHDVAEMRKVDESGLEKSQENEDGSETDENEEDEGGGSEGEEDEDEEDDGGESEDEEDAPDPYGRREIESEGSDYQPSVQGEPEPEPEQEPKAKVEAGRAKNARPGIQEVEDGEEDDEEDDEEDEEGDEEDEEDDEEDEEDDEEDEEDDEEDEEDDEGDDVAEPGLLPSEEPIDIEQLLQQQPPSQPRKRKRTPPPFNEPVDNCLRQPPRKRQRLRLRTHFNEAYLSLVNDNIKNAMSAATKDPGDTGNAAASKMPYESQVGLSIWTAEQKALLYRVLARLGEGDVQGITRHFQGAKSHAEVRQYLHLLRTSAARRRGETEGSLSAAALPIAAAPNRTKSSRRPPLRCPPLSEFPAAAEISEECCAALEKAADDLAVRLELQDVYDEGIKLGRTIRPQRRGEKSYIEMGEVNITAGNCTILTYRARTEEQAALKEIAARTAVTAASSGEQQPGRQPDGQFKEHPDGHLSRDGEQPRAENDKLSKPGDETKAQLAPVLGHYRPPALAFFRVPEWLTMAERFFMNSRDIDNNWMSMPTVSTAVIAGREEEDETEAGNADGSPDIVTSIDGLPAIRRSALDDFYSIARGLTQELVAASIFNAQSRLGGIEEKNTYKRVVRASDVRAAAASMSLPRDSRKFWARSARRLNIRVYREPEATFTKWGRWAEENLTRGPRGGKARLRPDAPPEPGFSWEEAEDQDGGTTYTPMTFDQVEKELLPARFDDGFGRRNAKEDDNDASSDENADEEAGEDVEDIDPVATTYEERALSEYNELVNYTALGSLNTNSYRASAKTRIQAELREEADLEDADIAASWKEEKALWLVLGIDPDMKAGEGASTAQKGRGKQNKAAPKETIGPEARSPVILCPPPPSLHVHAEVAAKATAEHEKRVRAQLTKNHGKPVRRFPLEELYDPGRDWRERMVYQSEWETRAAETKREIIEAAEAAAGEAAEEAFKVKLEMGEEEGIGADVEMADM